MSLDYSYVRALSSTHPAWRLLRMRYPALVISFLHRAYIEPNRRLLHTEQFTALLDDELYSLRQMEEAENLPKDATSCLAKLLEDGLLKRTWSANGNEEYIDLIPQTEKAIRWVASLRERSFVGTESRLLTFVRLVREMAEESDPDPEARLAALHRQRSELEAKIERVSRGDFEVLGEFEIRDRFQQIEQLGRELLGDFREVEDNFRKLSRSARERIALWDGSKGRLLDDLWRSHDDIRDSDQGRSFEAFHSFLLHIESRDELAALLSKALDLPVIRLQARDARLDRVHYDWIDAGEATHQTIAALSQQLRRFLDDKALLENRRIMEILRNIEARAIALRDVPPQGAIADIDGVGCDISLPMDRPLYSPTPKLTIVDSELEDGQAGEDADALYSRTIVDRTALAHHISEVLEEHGTATLRDLTLQQPITKGLAEIITYLDLGSSRFATDVLDFLDDDIAWEQMDGAEIVERTATMHRMLFQEKAK